MTRGIASFLVCTGLLFASLTVTAQLTGTKTVGSGGDYTTLAAAITDLNTLGVGPGGVTFNVAAGHTETATAPLLITATGSASDPIVIQTDGTGPNPLITRTDAGSNTTSSLGAFGDAVIQINGGDYITIDGIDISTQLQSIEYGILTQKTATNGSQYVTIKNCNITMTKGTSGYVVGINISNGSTSTSSATGVTVSANSGRNENIVIAGNTISNVHAGILIRGYSTLAYHDQNITIGQNGMGNIIQNFGGGSNTTTYGVYMIYVTNANVSYNTIDNAGGGGSDHGLTLYGIFNSTTSGAGISVYNNNAINLGISSTSAAHCIYDGQTGTSKTFNNNVFSYGTFNSTSSSYIIYSSNGTPNIVVSGNQIAGFTKSGASGALYFYYNNGSPGTGMESIFNNNISGITVSGSSTFYGIYTTTAAAQTQKIYNNFMTNITGGSGSLNAIYTTIGNIREIYNNTVAGFNGQGAITAIYSGSGNNTSIYKNQIFGLTSSSTSSTVGTISGIQLAGGNHSVYNNYISDLTTPGSASIDAIRGISITSNTATTTHKIYYNTIYLDATSTAANFGTSGIYHTTSTTATTAALDMRNNIIVNNSTPNGTGFTAAFRRSAATSLANLSNDCNNNCFYAGSPGSNNVIFYNGTTGYQTILDYQTLVAPREGLSFSENPPFLNSATAPFDLHLDGTTSTSCEGGGQEIAGFTTDFDNDLRYGAPGYLGTGLSTDVGADEYEGTPNYTCSTPAPGSTLASDNNICLGKSVLLTIQNLPSGTGISYQWQSSTDGVIFTDISNATQVQLQVTPAGNTWYQCNITCLAGPATVASTPVLVAFANIAPTGTGATRCGTGTVNLSATASSPTNTLVWYDSPTGGTVVGTGSPFTTPVISTTTDYYVAEETQATGISVLGNGTSTSTGYQGPFYYSYGGEKSQYLIRASELQALGMAAGNITSIALDITSAGTTFTDLDVSMGTTSVNALSSTFETGLTSVYSDPAFTPTVGINTFTFTTPFYWDGTSNLLINFCWSKNDGGGTIHSHVKYDATSFVATIYQRYDNQPASYVCGAATRYSSYSSRPQFFINGVLSCSGPRTEVTATVTPPPAFTVSPDVTVCPGLITPISVTSNLNDYDTYYWDPVTDLYLDAAATIPYTANTSATTVYFMTNGWQSTYTCTAANAALCANTDDITITVMPSAPAVTASFDELCFSGTTNLSVAPSTGYGAGTLQWQSSPDNVTFTDITGANATTYLTPTLTANTYYQLVIKDQNGILCQQPWIEIVVNNPQILTTTPGTRCGIGTLTLEATANSGANVSWYNTPAGGTPLANGTIFTTPVISTTTDYYVAASINETISQVGAPNTNISASKSGQTTTSAGINFSVLAPSVTIQSVDIYPNAAVGSPFTIYVRTGSTSGTIVASYSGTTTVQGSNTNPQLQTVPVNFVIPQGTGYVMHLNPNPSTIRNSGGDAFPYTVPGVISLTSSTGSTYYYYLYNWTVKVGCSSPRIPVTATVTPPPALTATPDQTVCNDAVAMLEVTSTLADFDQYIWTPETNLFTDAACTLPYIAGTSATTLYVRTTTAGAYTYTCTATHLASNCVNIATSTVTVKAPIMLNVTANPLYVCPGDNSQLNVVATQAGLTPTWNYLWSPLDYITGQEALQNPLATAMMNTTQYTVSVTGDGCSATGNITVTVQAGPAITTQPVSFAVCDGGNASFSVTATGPGLTYQWRLDGLNINPISNPTASTPTLILYGVTSWDAGVYDVVVSASCGTPVTSNMAVLTVNPVPTALAANNSPICENTALMLTGTTDIGTEFIWTGPNGYISSAQNPTISNAALTSAGTYTFKTVLNGCTSLVSNTVVLLNPMPVFTAVTANPASICFGETSNLTASVLVEQTADKYLFSTGAGSVLDPMTGGTSVIFSGNDDTPTPSPAPIGFTFNYEGVDYTNYSVSPDGWVLLGNTTAASQYTNSITSTTNIPKIYPYWDDLATGTDGNVQTLISGTAPNRIFIVQWYVTIPRNTTGAANSTFQLWLYETSNKIEFRYGTMASGSMSASVGITGGNSAKYQSITLATGVSSITAPNDNNAGQPVPGTIYSFLPPPPASFAWTPAASVVSPLLTSTVTNPLASTAIFTITATGANNCTNSQDVTVTVNPLPTATTTLATTEYICPGESKTLTVDLTGTPPWSLTVNDGTGPVVVPGIMTSPWTFTATPTIATTYTVTSVTDANCTNSSTLSVTVDFHPVPAPVISGFTTPICPNSTTVLDAGAGFSSYIWSDNSTQQTLLVDGSVMGGNSSATYSVTVTNSFGCADSYSVTITTFPDLHADAGMVSPFCYGFSGQLDANGNGGAGTYIAYNWNPSTGLSANNIKNPVASPTATTTYTVTITDQNNCTATDDVVVTVYPLPVVSLTGLGSGYCVDAPAVALVGSPAGGVYSGAGVTGNLFDPAQAGPGIHTVTYTYTDGNGCTNFTTLATEVYALPVVSFSTTVQICVNANPIVLTGGLPGGGSYSGPGVSGGLFSPTVAGSGNQVLTYSYTDGNSCTNIANHTILVHALTPLTFPPMAGICISEAPFAFATAMPAGGTYTGTGVSNNSFDPAAAGAGIHTITYTYTDGNGCTNSITQTIQVYPLPVLVMSNPVSICAGNSTQIEVSPVGVGGFTFLWNNATSLSSATVYNPIATPVNTTTFTVTVTDMRGCKKTGSVAVTVNPIPVITLNPSIDLCEGSATQLNVQVSPAGTYNYSWNNGATLSSTSVANPVASPSTSTTYTVIATNSITTCSKTAQTVVNVLPNPIPVITGLNTNYCLNATPVLLTGNPAGGSFTINGQPAVSMDPTLLGSGTHTVVYHVTQANNCTASKSQLINIRSVPTADAGQDVSVCTGFQVILGASATGGSAPYTYLWAPAGMVSNPNISNPSTNPSTTTTYTVVVTDQFGCSSSDEVVVNTTSVPAANAGPDVTICKGEGTQLQASGGTTYAWVPSTGLSNPNISDPIASPTVTTTYNVIVVSSCGIAADQVVVTVLPLPSVDFTGLPADACINGTPITLTGIPAGGVFSGPGVTGNVFDPTQAGGPGIVDISYTISGSNGCDNTITKSVHVRPMTTGTILNLAPLYCASGNGVTLSGIPTGGTFAGPGMAGNMFNPAMAGVGVHTIIYTFSDQYGCLNTITQQTTVYAPVVNITNLAPDYCVNGAAVTLTGTPAGGIFSGTGMNGAKFVPSVAGVGTHNITYWAQDGNNCWGTVTVSTVVLPPTPVSFTGLAPTYCTSDPIATLTPSPAGGTFSGPGIVGNTFNPATSSTGTRVIWYTVSGPGFCKNSVTQTTVVSPVPAVSFSGLNNSYCVSALPVNLSFAPAGGTFTGNGMTGNVFTPTAAGPGNHTITYSFTSPAGCTNSMTKNTLVNPLPLVSFSGLNATYCINDGPALLTGSPAGGYFNGPGIQYGIYFNPALAGIGTHTITYSYKDVNQCTNVATATVTVTALPTATFQNPAGVCIDAAPVTLTATPAGGTFTGQGVVNGVFYPNLAGTGTHSLSYSITNVNGCSGTLTTTIQVYALPSVTFSYVKTNHCNNAAPVTLSGNPAGGTFTGNGMIGNVFHPALAGVGTHIITYTYTNANGCTKSATRTLNVIAAPVVSFTGLASTYCINEPTVTLTGTPAGGYFSGPGAGLTSFSPVSAGAGTHTITYTLSQNGCTSTASQQVTVNPLPVVSFMNIPSSYCINQGPLTLNATPAGGTFTFSGNGLTGNILDPVVAGVGGYNLFYAYTDPVTGCSKTIKMVIYIRPVSAATLIGPATVCQSGVPVIMSGSPATPAGTYTGPGMSGNLFNPGVAGAGTHTITYNYTNGFGCVTMANHSVTVLAGPVLTLPPTATVCSNQTITLTADPGAASYQWSTGASTQSIVVDGAVLGLGTHNISVTATNVQGCSSTANTVLSVISCKIDGTAGLTESVTAYPNPSSGIYKLTLSHFTGNTEMSVFNELGQLITRETLQTGEGDTFIKELDLSVLPSGVYTVKFTNEKATRTIKLILQ